MTKTLQKRTELTEQMAEYLLKFGFHQFTLRSVAQAIGTSDRMLLHYFVDKQDLLTETLTTIAKRLIAMLESKTLPMMSVPQLVLALSGLLNHPELQKITHLWLELLVKATREGEPYQTFANQMMGYFLDWVEPKILPRDGETPAIAAAQAMVMVEGLVVLNAAGRQSEVEQVLESLKRS
ncbi:MAG TPA: TetR/AcrR family transcriptional regulator [Anaerolineales bacterium]|nr:TetR/AcrR family transcriptional regulator [Anaerolineales bacterium]